MWLQVVIVLSMNTYKIYCTSPTATTNDQHDGFGDYLNFRTRMVTLVDAATEKAALKAFKNTQLITYYAEPLTDED